MYLDEGTTTEDYEIRYSIYYEEIAIRKRRDDGYVTWEETTKRGCDENIKPKNLLAVYDKASDCLAAFRQIMEDNPKSYPHEEIYGGYKLIKYKEWAVYESFIPKYKSNPPEVPLPKTKLPPIPKLEGTEESLVEDWCRLEACKAQTLRAAYKQIGEFCLSTMNNITLKLTYKDKWIKYYNNFKEHESTTGR